MSSGRPGPSGPTASRSTRRATSSSPATRPATSTAATPATRPTTCFVVKFDPAGTQKWLRQFGVPGLADRGYAIATDATSNVYVTGYTRGNLAAVNLGDKDIYIAKLDSAGTQLWLKQFGSAGEDKAWGVAATGDGIRLGGMTSGAMGSTPAGALDGWVARYDAAGNAGLADAVRHDRATRRSGA